MALRWLALGIVLVLVVGLCGRRVWRALDPQLAVRVAVFEAARAGAERDPFGVAWIDSRFPTSQPPPYDLLERKEVRWSAGPNGKWELGAPGSDDIEITAGDVSQWRTKPGSTDLVALELSIPSLHRYWWMVLVFMWTLLLLVLVQAHVVATVPSRNVRACLITVGSAATGLLVWFVAHVALEGAPLGLGPASFRASPGRAGLTAGALTLIALLVSAHTASREPDERPER